MVFNQAFPSGLTEDQLENWAKSTPMCAWDYSVVKWWFHGQNYSKSWQNTLKEGKLWLYSLSPLLAFPVSSSQCSHLWNNFKPFFLSPFGQRQRFKREWSQQQSRILPLLTPNNYYSVSALRRRLLLPSSSTYCPAAFNQVRKVGFFTSVFCGGLGPVHTQQANC